MGAKGRMDDQNRDVVIGIDPGLQGALAVIDQSSGVLLRALKMPDDARWLYHWFKGLREDFRSFQVALEKAFGCAQVGDRRQSASTMFSYGRHFGHLEAILFAAGITPTLIPARTWTSELHKGVEGPSSKVKSLIVARQIWPYCDFTLSKRAKKPNEGLVDAMLIAEFLRRRLT
jgi:hypothetical protein